MAAAPTVEMDRDFLSQLQPANRVNDGVLAAARLYGNRARRYTNRLVAEQRLDGLKDDPVIDIQLHIQLDVHRRSTLIIIVTGLDLLCLTFKVFRLIHYK